MRLARCFRLVRLVWQGAVLGDRLLGPAKAVVGFQQALMHGKLWYEDPCIFIVHVTRCAKNVTPPFGTYMCTFHSPGTGPNPCNLHISSVRASVASKTGCRNFDGLSECPQFLLTALLPGPGYTAPAGLTAVPACQ